MTTRRPLVILDDSTISELPLEDDLPSSGSDLRLNFSYSENVTPPAFGALVTVPSGTTEREVYFSIAMDSGALTSSSVTVEVETGIGTGLYSQVLRLRQPPGASVRTLSGAFVAASGRRYRFIEDMTGGTRDFVFYSFRDISAVSDSHVSDAAIHFTLEDVDDRVSALIIAGNQLTKTYDDALGTLTLSVSEGAGSDLDADLLDGQHGAFYQNAANLNAGVLPAARFNDTAHGSRSGGSLHSLATTGAHGFMSSSDKSKLDGVEPGATADQTAADIRALGFFDTTNDGSLSGLDSDLLDGLHASQFLRCDVSNTFSGPALDIAEGSLLRHQLLSRSMDWKSSSNDLILTIDGTGGSEFSFVADGVAHTSAQLYIGGQRAFTDSYHPNADKWTTGRTLTVGATGKVVDGTANVSWSLAEIGALGVNDKATDSNLLDGIDSTQFLRSDVDDTFAGTLTVVGDLKVNGNGKQLIGGIGAIATTGVQDWNDSSNARSGSGFTLLNGTDANGPGGSELYHPFSFEYNTKNGTGNMTQLAVGYTTNQLHMRHRYNSTWSQWDQIYTDSYHPNADYADNAGLLDGVDSSQFLRSDVDDTIAANYNVVSGKYHRFGHANELDTNDGKIGARLFAPGLNIIGTQTEVGGNREIRLWGDVVTSGGEFFYHDGYHPTADRWTTARTLSLTGDASGSTSWDGSGNASISVVVADDSHNHIIGNVDGLQAALDGKAASGHTHDDRYYTESEADGRFTRVSSGLTSNLDTFYDADFFGWNNTTVGRPEDFGQGIAIVSSGKTYNQASNWITQLAFGTSESGSYFRTRVNAGAWSAWRKLWNDANDGSGSGLDADLLDGQHGSFYQNAGNLNAGILPSARLSGSYGISISGNAATATTLQTARTINGTSFNGGANITTASWGTSRTLTIGSTGKAVNGSGNVSWSLAEIGALGVGAKAADSNLLDGLDSTAFALAGHNHDASYLGINAKAADSNLLDGLDNTFFRNAGNLNAGTLPGARFNDTSHGSRGGGSLHSLATSGANGFMSAADKAKLDGIQGGATTEPYIVASGTLSSATSVDFTIATLQSAAPFAAKRFEIRLNNIRLSNNADIWVRCRSANSNASFSAANTDHFTVVSGGVSGGTSYATGANSTHAIVVGSNMQNFAAFGNPGSVRIMLENPESTLGRKGLSAEAAYVEFVNGAITTLQATGVWVGGDLDEVLSAIRLLPSAGNISCDYSIVAWSH